MLNRERMFLSSMVPSIDKVLSDCSMMELEQNSQRLVGLLKSDKLPGMFVAEEYGGMGMTGMQAVMIQMALASRSPSLALMMTMHNFTILTIRNMTASLPYSSLLLQASARDNCLVASGFAEGRSGADILDSNVLATMVNGGYELSGSKKPCTMAQHFDFLTAGISYRDDAGTKIPGLAIIPRSAKGISHSEFWSSPVLAAAGSHEVKLDRVFIDNEKVLIPDKDDTQLQLAVFSVQKLGLSWFQLLVSSSYLGVAAALVEKLLAKTGRCQNTVFDVAVLFQSSVNTLERLAQLLDDPGDDDTVFEQSLSIRFSVQQQINRIVDLCVEHLGGLNYIQNEEVQYLLAASRCLAFHPLSKSASKDLLIHFLEQR